MKKKKVYYVPSSVLLLLLIDLCYVLKKFEIKIVFETSVFQVDNNSSSIVIEYILFPWAS
jgi:hypothetical protein